VAEVRNSTKRVTARCTQQHLHAAAKLAVHAPGTQSAHQRRQAEACSRNRHMQKTSEPEKRNSESQNGPHLAWFGRQLCGGQVKVPSIPIEFSSHNTTSAKTGIEHTPFRGVAPEV
jgi:hypothetical protein